MAAPRKKKSSQRRTSTSVHVEAQDIKASVRGTVLSQLGGDLTKLMLRFGALAAAMTTIVVVISYTLPAIFRLYSSDSAPWEGRQEHVNDLMSKLSPVTLAIQNAAEAGQKASQAADRAVVAAQIAALKEDQRDLCGLVDRLSNINMRLKDTPADPFFIDAKAEREREIIVLKARIQAAGQLPEC